MENALQVKNLNNRKKYEVIKTLKDQKYLMVLLIPGLIYYLVFRYIPMYGIIISFKDYDFMSGIIGSDWVGLKYFKEIINGQYFWRLIRNTFSISAVSLIFGFPAPIIFAILLNELKSDRFKRLTQTISYLPYFLSTVVVVGLIQQIVSPTSGVLNAFLNYIGKDSINFLMEKKYFLSLYVISDIWQTLGYNAIIYIAALSGIDPSLYEAARIDGAGRFRCVINITLPSLLPTISVLLILRLGHLMDVGYEKIILMYNPSIYEVSDTISTYVYRTGIQNASYSFAAAVGLLNSLVAIILITVSNKVSNKISGDGLW